MRSAQRVIYVSEPDAELWALAVVSADGTVSDAQKRLVAILLRSLKFAGVWSSLDRLWLFAAENATQALIDIKALATATATNSPTFTAGRGYKGSHLSAYLNSNFNPTAGTPNYQRNSASYGLWVETAESDPAGAYRLMGNDSSNYSEISVGVAFLSIHLNQGSPTSVSTMASTATGLVTGSRIAASGAGSTTFYLNGGAQGTGAIASIALPNNNFNILAGNNAGAVYQQSDARVAAVVIGGALTAAQHLALYAALRAYMTSVGVA